MPNYLIHSLERLLNTTQQHYPLEDGLGANASKGSTQITDGLAG